MPLRYQYFGYILAIHGLVAWLLFDYFSYNKWYFLFSEFGILLSLLISVYLFRKFNSPLELMRYGVHAIKDEDYNVRFLETGSRDINELIEVFNTFLDKLRAEKVSAQEQGYFLENIIDASPIGMIMLDYDDMVTSYNAAAADILSKENLMVERSLFSSTSDLISFIAQLEIGEKEICNLSPTQRFKCQLNSIIHLGFKRKFIMIEEMSKELLATEKAAYGKVIRMMAHEVNNSMGAVNSILQSVISFGFTEEQGEYKEILEVAKTRNEELANFMKNFADVIRLPPPNKESTNLVDLCRRSILIMGEVARSVDVHLELETKLSEVYVMCDISQLQQVVINAIKNSIESIGDQGSVKIKVSNIKPQLSIVDDGPGIKREVKDQLFTPFFSTKADGQGIGLIISREILVSHNAKFQLYTNETDGLTYFDIELD